MVYRELVEGSFGNLMFQKCHVYGILPSDQELFQYDYLGMEINAETQNEQQQRLSSWTINYSKR